MLDPGKTHSGTLLHLSSAPHSHRHCQGLDSCPGPCGQHSLAQIHAWITGTSRICWRRAGHVTPCTQTLSGSPKDSSEQPLQNQVKYQCMTSSTAFSNFLFLRSDKKGKEDFPLNVSLKIFQQLTHKAFRHFNFHSNMNTLTPNETY